MKGRYTRPRGSTGFRFVVEQRGGWDEWSDKYQAVVGLKTPDDDVLTRTEVHDGFEAGDGGKINVDLPMRYGDNMTVEWYDPEYRYEEVSISEFEDMIDNDEIRRKA